MRPGENLHSQFLQALGTPFQLPVLPAENVLHTCTADKPQSLRQSRVTGYVQRPRFQTVRQVIRHGLIDGVAARPAEQQRLGIAAAEQQPRPLRPQQPLMPRHGDKIRPQRLKIHGQRPGGLGGIDDERHPPFPAHLRQLLHGQNIAEHVGNVGKYRRVRPLLQFPPEAGKGVLPVKQPPPRHPDIRPQRMKRAGHGVVLEPGHDHPSPRLHDGTDGNI